MIRTVKKNKKKKERKHKHTVHTKELLENEDKKQQNSLRMIMVPIFQHDTKELLVRRAQEWTPESSQRGQGNWGRTTGYGGTVAGETQGRYRKREVKSFWIKTRSMTEKGTMENREHRGWKRNKPIKWHKSNKRNRKIRKKERKR